MINIEKPKNYLSFCLLCHEASEASVHFSDDMDRTQTITLCADCLKELEQKTVEYNQ